MNKKIIIGVVIAAMVMLGSGAAYATGQIAKSNAISESDAINFAFVDAGVQPDDAVVTQVEFDYEKGVFVYEIEFYVDGTEYEYTIDSTNGKVIEKSVDHKKVPGTATTKEGNSSNGNSGNTQTNKPDAITTDCDTISLEAAKAAALKEAGVKADQVVFEKAKLEKDDGILIYDIEFYVPGDVEWDFEIDAGSGAVIEKSYETIYNPAAATSPQSGDSGSGSGDGAAATGNAGAGSGNAGAGSSSGNSGSSNSGSSASAPTAAAPAQSGNTGSGNIGSAAASGSTGSANNSGASSQASTPTPAPASNIAVSGDDTYKVENGQVYEYDDDDGTWELEKDKKIENGKVYEYDDDDGWELEDDDDDDD